MERKEFSGINQVLQRMHSLLTGIIPGFRKVV
jgi:hypothetical protein